MRPSALLSLAVALVLLAVARHDHGGLVPPSVESLKPGSNGGKALIVLYGVLARGLGYTWPYIRNAIIAPLEQDAGLAVTIVGIDIDVGSHHVDGQILDRSFFESSVVASQSDIMCANSSLRTRPSGALPFACVLSVTQDHVDADLRTLCRATAPGCLPKSQVKKIRTDSKSYNRLLAGMRCPPFASTSSTPPSKKRAKGEAQTPQLSMYSPSAMQNAYRQLHVEARVSEFLREYGPGYKLAIAMSADVLPLVNLRAAHALTAAEDESILLTPDQMDRFGVTNGFMVGNPKALMKVTGRLQDLILRHKFATEIDVADYEHPFIGQSQVA